MSGALILCGGIGKRIGLNKALIKISDKPLLLHVVEKMIGSVDELVVSIGMKDNPTRYSEMLPEDVKVINDKISGKGPLAGIISGMNSMSSRYTAVFPCDSPFLHEEVLKFMFDNARGFDAAIPRWPNGYLEPLHAVYKVSSALSAAKNVGIKTRWSVIDMIMRLNKVVYLDTVEIKKLDPELLTFFNINKKEDLKVAAEIIGR